MKAKKATVENTRFRTFGFEVQKVLHNLNPTYINSINAKAAII